MKLSFVGLSVIVLICSACSSTQKEDECATDECLKQRAYDEVIAVHDVVMPKLSAISELKGKLEERMNTTEDTLVKASCQMQMEALDDADKAMWVWMRNFNSNLDDVPVEEALKYLAAEKKKVDVMAEKVSTAITSAEKSLE